MRHGTAKEGRGRPHEVRHSTAKSGESAGEVRHGTAKSGGSADQVRHAPRKGEHNPTRNRKFANANNVSRRFMLPFY